MASSPLNIIQQFLADTDPSKDYSKETVKQMQERTARIARNYTTFFQTILRSGLPIGGETGDILSKKSSDNFDTEWKALSAIVPGNISIYNERPEGARDGINKVFSTFNVFKPSSTRVHKGPLRLVLGEDADYIETGPNEITLLCPFRATDILSVDYEIQNTILT